MSHAARVASVALVVAIAAAAQARTDETRAALTEEAVVRLFVGGTPLAEILERVATSPVEFDLSEEMLRELELAGLPDELIQAMQRRQNELAPPPAPPSVPGRESADAQLSIEIDARQTAEGQVVRASGVVDFMLRERWQLERELEGEPFEDLAVFLACRSPTHVPDHWRTETPLGSDFSAPRHRMHAFIAGAQKSAPSTLVLVLPEQLEIALEAGEPHDLTLGLAVAVQGRYYVAAEARLEGVVLTPGPSRRFAKIETPARGEVTATKITFVNAPDDDEETDQP